MTDRVVRGVRMPATPAVALVHDLIRIALRGHGGSLSRRAIGLDREGHARAIVVGHGLGAQVALHGRGKRLAQLGPALEVAAATVRALLRALVMSAHRLLWWAGCALLGALLLAGHATASTATAAESEALRARLALLRSAGDAHIGAGSAEARALIAAVYERRGFAPLWGEPQRLRALLGAIQGSRSHGLDPGDYHADLLAAALPSAGDAMFERARAQRELLATDAMVRLAYHLHFGKADPRALQQGWNFARTIGGTDPPTALGALLEAPDPAAALDALAPQLPTYGGLRQGLQRLQEIERAGGWPVVAAGPALVLVSSAERVVPGGQRRESSGARVLQLRARLQADDALGANADDAAQFDAGLDAAVRRFQSRHGLEPDGVVGRETLIALNLPVAQRIAQVRANLERLRWVARELAGDYLLVDIAGFTAQLWLNNQVAWSARVVVGRPYRRTPEFRSRMQTVVLNPSWTVPPTILRQDVLPQVIQDPGYLERRGMSVIDGSGQQVDPASIAWSEVLAQPGGFAHRIVQAPGPENALGRIRFTFPNDHTVFLHDTPARDLFERTTRAFSSGCIRIEHPIELARLLLDDPERWSEERLNAAIDSGRTLTLPVRHSVPVLLLYFTASAAPGGELQFRPDLYTRDAPIIGALAAPFRFASMNAQRPPAQAR